MLDFPLTIGDEKLGFQLLSNAEALWLQMPNGPRVPLLEIETHDKMQRRFEHFGTYQLEGAETDRNGIELEIQLSQRGLSFQIELQIVDGELAVRFDPASLREEIAPLYRLRTLHFLPGLLRAAHAGTLLLPLVSGVLASPRGKPKLKDEFLIYGEQERWELLPTMPICAAQDPNGGWMALATQGAADTLCRVQTDGQGNGEVGFGFSVRRLWHDPIDAQKREIRFVPIPRSARIELFCAERLRRHCIEDLGTPTLEKRAQNSPQTRYLLASYVHKIFHASPREAGLFSQIMQGQSGASLESAVQSPVQTWTTFSEATTALERLKNAGIERITTQSVGWNTRGHDGLYPTRFPIEEAAGGEGEFRKMLQKGTELGFGMAVHDNYIDGYRASPDFDLETTIFDSWGEPLVCGWWGGGLNFRQNILAFASERLEGQMKKVQSLGISGAYYCDAMGNPLEVNYHPQNGGPRSQHERGIQKILDTGREIFGGIATECGFLYAAIRSDAIAMNGGGWNLKQMLPADWPVAALCDRVIPLWELALHDLVALEGQEISPRGTLKKLLFGLLPRVEWCARPGLFPVCDDGYIRAVKADYDLCVQRFGHLRTQRLTDWKAEGEQEMTRFEDGTLVEANFQTQSLVINGQKII